ncbi:hypothetical protein ACFE04_021123 [Oxalis oulophora]
MKRPRKLTTSVKGGKSSPSIDRIANKKPTTTTSTQNPKLDDATAENKIEEYLLAERIPLRPLCPAETSSKKIKLQLFPIDNFTQLQLQNDGYHPFLELTLSATKKISSVLKHLTQKWGRSTIALGDPMLFPYHTLQNSEAAAAYRWTSNDRQTTAGDVYAAIGTPTLFRLRYGWSGSGTVKSEPSSQSGANKENAFVKVEQTAVTNQDFVNSIIISEEPKTEKPEIVSSDELVDPKVYEGRLNIGVGQSSMGWADCFANISIGGLLSEASLQGKFNQCGPKSNVSQPVGLISDSLDAFLAGQMNQSQGPMMMRPPKSDGSNAAGFQPSQLTGDSFDAFIASQLNQTPCPKLPTFDTHSSILDAEDTCLSFALQKNSSSGKGASTFSRGAFSRVCSQDGGSRLSKFPNVTETNSSKSGVGKECQESETELKLCSRVYNDENSLSMSGIKWV